MLAVEPLPGWKGRFFHSQNMTFGHWEISADAAALHEHHHPNEEVWNIVDGTVMVAIDGHERTLGPGDVAVVPPDTPHSVRAVSRCRVVVADFPVRRQLPGTDGPGGPDGT
jgi:mannose-6-phosphate isomerase-like protein (cupin superfamily)